MSKLAIQFVRWIIAVSFLVTLTGILVATYLENRSDVRNLRAQIDGVATFVPTLAASVWRLDDTQIALQLQGIVQLPAVARAAVMVDGEVEYQMPGDGGLPAGGWNRRYPLVFESAGGTHELGELVVVEDLSTASDRIPNRLLEVTAIQLVRGAIVALVIFWVFSHLVGRRIARLSRDIGDLNWDNLQTRPMPLEPAHQDELADVRKTLERMRRRILDGIERHAEAQAELEHRRLYDGVTGLPNRTLLRDRLALLRANTEQPLTAIAIELTATGLDSADYTSQLNAGLLELADTLNDSAGDRGIACRYSDKRFVLIVGGLADESAAAIRVNSISDALEEPFASATGSGLFFSGCFGIAVESAAAGSEERTTLVSRALMALDAAVGRGAGAQVFWRDSLEQGSVYQQVRLALRKRAFTLHCQPIFDALTTTVARAECLLRWDDEGLRLHGIERTVRMLDSGGAHRALDEAVVEKAAELHGQLAGQFDGRLAVNLTARTFSDPEFVAFLQALPERFLACLDLELTETSVLHDLDGAQRVAEQISELGVGLVLDDFGTGYSAIEYLGRFRFDTIKIDRSFFASGVRNQERLLRAMISIAHGVGSTVVAEGLESTWQLDLARRLGVDQVQGFYLSEPLSPAQFSDFLTAERREPA